MTLGELKQEAAKLSEAERAELALSIIESLDATADSGVEEAWRLEIERRAGEVERGQVDLVPGDQVITQLRRRLG